MINMLTPDQLDQITKEAERLYPDIEIKEEADIFIKSALKEMREKFIKWVTWGIENVK